MLTRSPIPASSSPRSGLPNFHHGPAPLPRSPRRNLAVALSRRPSATSLPASASPRPLLQSTPYLDIPASAQYSPIESVDHCARSTTELTDSPHPTGAKPVSLSIGCHARKMSQYSTENLKSIQPPKRTRPTITGRTVSHKRRSSGGPGPSCGSGPGPVGAAAGALLEASVGSKRFRAESEFKLLPQRYELCSIQDMVILIAHMLGELIETNDSLALRSGHLTRFHSRTAPAISVLDYLQRLAKHATLTTPLLLVMVYYIDRLCAMYSDFTINTLTVHRFLITAATVAAKGLSDAFWNNSTYARVGGVRVAELKLLELEFLHRVEWRIIPSPEVLVAYYQGLAERCPGYVLDRERDSVEEDENSDCEAMDEADDQGEREIAWSAGA